MKVQRPQETAEDWKKHYTGMSEGRLVAAAPYQMGTKGSPSGTPSKALFTVNSNQTGAGAHSNSHLIKVVSPVAQEVDRAKAEISRGNKRTRASRSRSVARNNKRTKKAPPKRKQKAKKPSKKGKQTRRVRRKDSKKPKQSSRGKRKG